MSQNENKSQLIKDIIDIEETALPIDLIETIIYDKEIRKTLEQKYKGDLYSTILRSLTHKNFPEGEAVKLWEEIIKHMERLNSLLDRKVGVAVASLDYLTNIKDKLSEPKIIEEKKSSFIAEASTKDELTELYSRDVFDTVLKKEVAEAQRKNIPTSLLMIDIDDFKEINDNFGHPEGDRVLKAIGSALNELVREMDTAARYGGEELAIIMPSTNINNALDVAERIRNTIEALQFGNFIVTASIGAASSCNDNITAEKLVEQADSALYKAKEQGKNQVQKYKG